MTNTYNFSVIIYKFCYEQKFCQIVLYLNDKNVKISLYYTVLPFSLVICLQIKYNGKLLLNTIKIV